MVKVKRREKKPRMFLLGNGEKYILCSPVFCFCFFWLFLFICSPLIGLGMAFGGVWPVAGVGPHTAGARRPLLILADRYRCPALPRLFPFFCYAHIDIPFVVLVVVVVGIYPMSLSLHLFCLCLVCFSFFSLSLSLFVFLSISLLHA